MAKIQVVFLFTRLSELSPDIKDTAKRIVIEEYCKAFDCDAQSVEVKMYDGSVSGKTSDVHIYINSDEHFVNEGSLRMNMRKEISSRYRLLFPSSLGFNGIITASDGKADTTVKDNKSPTSPSQDPSSTKESNDPAELEKRSSMYQAVEPKYTFDMVQLPDDTLKQIDRALGRIEYEQKVFEEWGLYAIMPNPVSALGFFGPPGTGKTLAAEAIADKMGKKIVRVSYADIENKYVGEGPKNVKAVFYAAQKQDAVLFIDEADSLLSKRLTNVSDGTGQAFNSMRSQLLMSLESFHGIAIFATNLVVNYDKAFLSRLISIEFKNPDAALRRQIWETHLMPKHLNGHQLSIPLSEDVDIDELSEKYDLCGRDIRNAVIDACVEACLRHKDKVDQECLRFGAQARVASNESVEKANDYTSIDKSDLSKNIIAKTLNQQIQNGNYKAVNVNDIAQNNKEGKNE